jgi:hypothetical protein
MKTILEASDYRIEIYLKMWVLIHIDRSDKIVTLNSLTLCYTFERNQIGADRTLIQYSFAWCYTLKRSQIVPDRTLIQYSFAWCYTLKRSDIEPDRDTD